MIAPTSSTSTVRRLPRSVAPAMPRTPGSAAAERLHHDVLLARRSSSTAMPSRSCASPTTTTKSRRPAAAGARPEAEEAGQADQGQRRAAQRDHLAGRDGAHVGWRRSARISSTLLSGTA